MSLLARCRLCSLLEESKIGLKLASLWITIRFVQRSDACCEVGAFYWTVPAPDIVNPGREEQGSVSV